MLQNVNSVESVRLVFDSNGKPAVEYLACWKDDLERTWEPTDNLSEDLIRDFEEAFWNAVKKQDQAFIDTALQYGTDTVANMVDETSRSALHYASALNNTELVKQLLDAGALPNVQDAEGYTPLHMASGYLHQDTVSALLDGGADPSVSDSSGKNVTDLVDSIREKIQPAQIKQRLALEEVAKAMTMHVYEDVLPEAVLAVRETDEGDRQFLVQWVDGADDSWIPEDLVSEEVRADWDSGLEYAKAAEILDVRGRGDAKEYLVRWQDSHADSWEDEDGIAPKLVTEFYNKKTAAKTAASTKAEKPVPIAA